MLFAHRGPKPPGNDQPAKDIMDHTQGLTKHCCAQDRAVKGQGVVEHHGSPGPQCSDPPVPGPITDDGRNHTDVDNGGNRLQSEIDGDVLILRAFDAALCTYNTCYLSFMVDRAV